MWLFKPLSIQKYCRVDTLYSYERGEPKSNASSASEQIAKYLAENIVRDRIGLETRNSHTEMNQTSDEQTKVDLINKTHTE